MIKASEKKKKSNASEWEGELFYYTSILAGTPRFAFSGRGPLNLPTKPATTGPFPTFELPDLIPAIAA